MMLPKCALIREAIVHVRKQQRGVSLVQIRKHLEATYEEKLDAKKKKFIFSTFKTLIQEGKLLQKGTVYKATKQRADVRADVPHRHRRRRHRRRRHQKRRHHRRRRHLRSRRRHHRRRHHRRSGHHRIKVHHRRRRHHRGRRHAPELPEEHPDYTNAIPSVEVPANDYAAAQNPCTKLPMLPTSPPKPKPRTWRGIRTLPRGSPLVA